MKRRQRENGWLKRKKLEGWGKTEHSWGTKSWYSAPVFSLHVCIEQTADCLVIIIIKVKYTTFGSFVNGVGEHILKNDTNFVGFK